MREYPLQYASTDKNKKSHYNYESIFYLSLCQTLHYITVGWHVYALTRLKVAENMADPTWFWRDLVPLNGLKPNNGVASSRQQGQRERIGLFCVFFPIFTSQFFLFIFLDFDFPIFPDS